MIYFGYKNTFKLNNLNTSLNRTLKSFVSPNYFYTTKLRYSTNKLSKSMRVLPVPVLQDNYSYLIIDDSKNIAVVVDPAEPNKVLEAANLQNVNIGLILTTHHHMDHAGGNEEMLKLVPNIQVVGGDERILAITRKVTKGDLLTIGSLNIKVHFTPCHTKGHVLYEINDTKESSKPHALFTGDTLFIGGCGRFFEGNAQEMYHNLIEVIANLPHETLIYCGHEYTQKNLEFATTLEPNNQDLKIKLEWTKQQRQNKLPTVPSTVSEELKYNPFMRVKEKVLSEVTNLKDPIEIMKEIRARKDRF